MLRLEEKGIGDDGMEDAIKLLFGGFYTNQVALSQELLSCFRIGVPGWTGNFRWFFQLGLSDFTLKVTILEFLIKFDISGGLGGEAKPPLLGRTVRLYRLSVAILPSGWS